MPCLRLVGIGLRRDRLQVEGEEHKGQENAMIVAATQNSRLLKVQYILKHVLHLVQRLTSADVPNSAECPSFAPSRDRPVESTRWDQNR